MKTVQCKLYSSVCSVQWPLCTVMNIVQCKLCSKVSKWTIHSYLCELHFLLTKVESDSSRHYSSSLLPSFASMSPLLPTDAKLLGCISCCTMPNITHKLGLCYARISPLLLSIPRISPLYTSFAQHTRAKSVWRAWCWLLSPLITLRNKCPL